MTDSAARGRIRARPRPIHAGDLEPELGLEPLGLGGSGGRDGLVFVPRQDRSQQPMPLVLTLHGAGGNARHNINRLLSLAEEVGFILVGVDAREQTWDVLLGEHGPDVAFIDAALGSVFERHAIDDTRIAVEGFSDGASYALSLGISNGDLFSHVIAFSPGFAAPFTQVGMPAMFVSHGTADPILPIDMCSRTVVPSLRRAGYDVTYVEFDGGHVVPPDIAGMAVDWFLGRNAPPSPA